MSKKNKNAKSTSKKAAKRGRPPKKTVAKKAAKRGRPPKKTVAKKAVKKAEKRGRPPKKTVAKKAVKKAVKKAAKRSKSSKKSKQQDPEILTREQILDLTEKWREGKLNKFKPGSVVKDRDTDKIGVIKNFEPNHYKYYSIKWHTGVPDKWSFIVDIVHEDDIKRSREKNPIDIPSWEKYPGPSADQISKLKQSFSEQRKNQNVDVEAVIESYEEDRKRKRTTEKIEEDIDEDEIDSVIDKTLEEDEEFTGDKIYEMLKRDLEDD